MKKSFLGLCLISSIVFANENTIAIVDQNLINAKEDTYKIINENIERFKTLSTCVDKAQTFEALNTCGDEFADNKDNQPNIKEEGMTFEEIVGLPEKTTQSEQAELVRKQEVSITNSLTKKEEIKTKRPQTLAIIEQLALTRLKELNVDHTTIVGDYLLNSYIDKYNDLKMKYEFSISKFDYLILDSLEAKAH